MFTVELYAGIRRAVMVDGLSRREAAKRFGVHRNTIPKMLQFSVPPGYRRRERPASKKLGPYMAWIDKVLVSLHGLDRYASSTAMPLEDLGKLAGGRDGAAAGLSAARASLPLASLLMRSAGIVAGAEQRVGC